MVLSIRTRFCLNCRKPPERRQHHCTCGGRNKTLLGRNIWRRRLQIHSKYMGPDFLFPTSCFLLHSLGFLFPTSCFLSVSLTGVQEENPAQSHVPWERGSDLTDRKWYLSRQQVAVDVTSSSCLLSVQQGSHDCSVRVQPRGQVRHGDAGTHGLPVLPEQSIMESAGASSDPV